MTKFSSIKISLKKNSIPKAMLALLASFLIASQVFHSLHYPLWFDDAFFANVAKSLANGEGYAAVFFDKSYLFHFGISSGPLIILPVAALIFFFGNQYWVGDVSNILLIWSLLVTIFILSDHFFGKEKKYYWALLALSLMLLFSIGIYGNSNTDRLALWHLLMGEIPAVLCLIIGVLLLFDERFLKNKSPLSLRDAESRHESRPVLRGSLSRMSKGHAGNKIVLGGLFIGLGVITKTIVAIAAAVVLVFYFIATLRDKKFSLSIFC